MKNSSKIQLIDKIIIIAIIISSLTAILGTIVWVNYKYKKNNFEEKKIVNNNSKYNYNYKENEIYFYNGKSLVGKYICNGSCSIEENNSDQFIINYKPIVIIHDIDKYIVYNVDTSSVMHILDYYPLKIESNVNYGKIMKSGKYGLINNKSGLVLDIEYNLIETEDKYLVTLLNDKINIYNELIEKINNKDLYVKNTKDIIVTKKDNYLLLNITLKNNKLTLYKYNLVTNNFE